MDHESTLLIYLETATPSTRIPSTQIVAFDRGNISSLFQRLCLEMRDEQKRLSSFEESMWKHSFQISQMLSKAGYFSVSESLSTKVSCSFCTTKFTFRLTTSNFDEQLTAFNTLQQRHTVKSATCPRVLGLKGDNIPFHHIHLQVDYPEQSTTCHSILESEIGIDWKEEADSEYCNEESEIRIEQLSNDGELFPIPYTMDLFSELLPVSGDRNQFEQKTYRFNQENSVDARDVKARLELETARYILASSEDTMSHLRASDNNSFFTEMSQENREKSLRVALESALFWQLKCTAEECYTFQDVFGYVWGFLTQMRNLNIQNPVQFADLYNENLTSQLLLVTPRSHQIINAPTQVPVFNHPVIQVQSSTLPSVNLATVPPATTSTTSSPTSIIPTSNTTGSRPNTGLGENSVQSIVCKVCLDEPAEYVLIPCGHFVACGTCTRQLKDCPICRQYIRGTIKPFFP